MSELDKAVNLSIDADGAQALNILAQEIIKSKKSERRWVRVKIVAVLTILGLAMISTGLSQWRQSKLSKVHSVSISGTIGQGGASADAIIPALKKAFQSKDSKAVILNIDSPGGSPSDADRISQSIEAFKAETHKPVVAIIDGVGASASYMIAVHADRIVAGKYSLVGSIGVIIQSWDYHQIMDKVGVKQRVFASGKLKTMLNPYAEMTPAAEAKAQEIVDRMAKTFVTEVKTARGTRLKEGNWFTGEVWPGEEAQQIGLIDEVGTIEDYVRKNYGDASVISIKPSLKHGWSPFDASGSAVFDALLRSVNGAIK